MLLVGRSEWPKLSGAGRVMCGGGNVRGIFNRYD